MRCRHQTRQATLGVQTQALNTENLELSLKQHLIHHMHDMLKQQNDQAVGTGAEHSVQWGTLSTPGNSANAAAVAVVMAKQVSIFFALLPTLPILCQHRQLLDEPLYSRRLMFPNCQKSRMLMSQCFGHCGLVTMALYLQSMASE